MDLRTGHSLWQGLQGPIPEHSAFEGDARAEVVIIGSGVTGALLSWILVQHGIEVFLVDKRQPSTGSTAASTGLLQYEVDTPLIELIEKVGQEAAVHAYRRGVQAIDELEELGRCCHESNQVREIGNLTAPGAILSGVAAEINPLALTLGLLQRAEAAGVRVYGKTLVEQVTELPDYVELRTATGSIRAQAVVYATGYEACESLGFSPGTLRSTFALAARTADAALSCPPELLLWETARPYFYVRHAQANQYLILGGKDLSHGETHADPKLLAAKSAALIEEFQQRFPACPVVPEYTWAGTFAETEDGLAYIGKLPKSERRYAALGYGGNGITFSMIAARLIRDLYIRRETPDAAVFSFAR